MADRNNERFMQGIARIDLGKILAKACSARSDDAEECIARGITILGELKLRPFMSQGHLYLGELYADTGRREKALERLKKAEAEFKAMGMDYWLRKTQEVLARVEG